MTTIDTLPEWIPHATDGPRRLPAGRWWDAVSVDEAAGGYLIARLDWYGPVIEDQASERATWFVPVGSATGWEIPGVTVLGAGRTVVVPPAEWTLRRWPGGTALRWLIPPGGDCLADPTRLYAALAALCVRAAG